MSFMKIHCENCGGSWEVYFRSFNDPKGRECPHCFERIEQQTWEKEIVPAFGAFSDANLELARDEANHRPRFTVDFVDNSLYANRYSKPRVVWRRCPSDRDKHDSRTKRLPVSTDELHP